MEAYRYLVFPTSGRAVDGLEIELSVRAANGAHAKELVAAAAQALVEESGIPLTSRYLGTVEQIDQQAALVDSVAEMTRQAERDSRKAETEAEYTKAMYERQTAALEAIAALLLQAVHKMN